MSNLELLEEKVDALYSAQNPERAEWADWLYQNHIFVVADYGVRLAEQFAAKPELVAAASLLHDIADAVTSRFDAQHSTRSSELAKQLLSESGFSDEEISVVVEDAIRFHSCRDGQAPVSIEGRVMAAADALAHLKTDFYQYGVSMMQKDKSIDEIKKWALPKIERDFKEKIFDDGIRQTVADDYERVKAFINNLE